MHSVKYIRPELDVLLNAGQLLHTDDVLVLKVPIAHCVQLPPVGPDHPAIQVQAVKAVLAGGESALAGQALHMPVPLISLYLPATQLIQSPSPSGDDPALQVQSAFTLLAAGE